MLSAAFLKYLANDLRVACSDKHEIQLSHRLPDEFVNFFRANEHANGKAVLEEQIIEVVLSQFQLIYSELDLLVVVQPVARDVQDARSLVNDIHKV